MWILVIGCIFIGCLVYMEVEQSNKQKKQKEEAVENSRKEDVEREELETAVAKAEGLEKFIRLNVLERELNRRAAEAMRILGGIIQDSTYQEKEHDWAVMGGIADAIGGPGAGLATALDAMQDNARIREKNEANIKWGVEQNFEMIRLANECENSTPKTPEMQQLMKKYKTFMDWNPETLFSKFSFTNTSADVDSETKAVSVSVKWECIDGSVGIDGAFRAKLYAFGHTCVGCAYLHLPQEGTLHTKQGIMRGICAVPKVEAKNYEVEIEPVNLWELDFVNSKGSEDSDHLTLEEHRKIVADYEAKFKAEVGM